MFLRVGYLVAVKACWHGPASGSVFDGTSRRSGFCILPHAQPLKLR